MVSSARLRAADKQTKPISSRFHNPFPPAPAVDRTDLAVTSSATTALAADLCKRTPSFSGKRVAVDTSRLQVHPAADNSFSMATHMDATYVSRERLTLHV